MRILLPTIALLAVVALQFYFLRAFDERLPPPKDIQEAADRASWLYAPTIEKETVAENKLSWLIGSVVSCAIALLSIYFLIS